MENEKEIQINSMKDQTRSSRNFMIWGIVLVTIQFKIGDNPIIPTFLCWLLIAMGIRKLWKVTPNKLFQRSFVFALLNAAVSAGNLGINVIKSSDSYQWVMLVGTISMLLEIICFYELFQGMITFMNPVRSSSSKKCLTFYLVIEFIGIAGYLMASYVFLNQSLSLVAMIILFFARFLEGDFIVHWITEIKLPEAQMPES